MDNGSWNPVYATDESFDSDYALVTFNLGNATAGNHTLEVQVTNSSGISYTTSTNISLTTPVNDLLSKPVVMSLNTRYTQSTSLATFTSEDPANVCNTGDTGSVWYQFTAPSTGVYTLDTHGSNYDPHLSVLLKMRSTSRASVVCGQTSESSNGNGFDEFSKL
jgi:hypothetical protein